MSLDQLMALVPIDSVNGGYNNRSASNTATGSKALPSSGRKSRWEKVKEKKNEGGSRWGPEDDKLYLPPPYVDLPAGLSAIQIDQFLREQRYDELAYKLAVGEFEYEDPDIRAPSPPPIYDKNGSRINTREVRVRTNMQSEYHRLTEWMIKTVQGFLPPPDYKPLKKVKKIEIPLDKYPEYNFMGLIIGPRGCNHKRLEAESGAQISVRGKGTQKEGKRTDHQNDEEASMPMHVHISADTEEALEKAVSLIEPLLDPFHPMHEEFKKRGLEQLALVNGIHFNQIEQARCAICSAVGHIAAECPDAQQLQNFKKPDVRCAICGDMGHVTMDCKLACYQGANFDKTPHEEKTPLHNFTSIHGGIPHSGFIQRPPPFPLNTQQQYQEKLKMDLEYKRMMNELTGESSGIAGLDESMKSANANLFNISSKSMSSLSPPVGVGMDGGGSMFPSNIITPPPGVSPFYGCGNGPMPNVESPLIPGTNPFAPLPPDGCGGVWTPRGLRGGRGMIRGMQQQPWRPPNMFNAISGGEWYGRLGIGHPDRPPMNARGGGMWMDLNANQMRDSPPPPPGEISANIPMVMSPEFPRNPMMDGGVGSWGRGEGRIGGFIPPQGAMNAPAPNMSNMFNMMNLPPHNVYPESNFMSTCGVVNNTSDSAGGLSTTNINHRTPVESSSESSSGDSTLPPPMMIPPLDPNQLAQAQQFAAWQMSIMSGDMWNSNPMLAMQMMTGRMGANGLIGGGGIADGGGMVNFGAPTSNNNGGGATNRGVPALPLDSPPEPPKGDDSMDTSI